MTGHVLLDELHVQLLIPRALAPAALAAVRRQLGGRPFRRRVVRSVLTRKALAAVRVRLNR